jgi:hypothetical protein
VSPRDLDHLPPLVTVLGSTRYGPGSPTPHRLDVALDVDPSVDAEVAYARVVEAVRDLDAELRAARDAS